MCNQEICEAKLLYTSNTYREKIGKIAYKYGENSIDIYGAVLTAFDSAGHPFREDIGRWYYIKSDEINVFSVDSVLDSTEVLIVYSEVIAPDSGAQFAEVDGVIIFFHMDERNHLHFPHVHARYAESEISISLKDFQSKGHLNSRRKERIAIEFVKENRDALYAEWKRIMQYAY